MHPRPVQPIQHAANCAADSRITPSVTGGQRNAPLSAASTAAPDRCRPRPEVSPGRRACSGRRKSSRRTGRGAAPSARSPQARRRHDGIDGHVATSTRTPEGGTIIRALSVSAAHSPAAPDRPRAKPAPARRRVRSRSPMAGRRRARPSSGAELDFVPVVAIARRYGLHRNQLYAWRKELRETVDEGSQAVGGDGGVGRRRRRSSLRPRQHLAPANALPINWQITWPTIHTRLPTSEAPSSASRHPRQRAVRAPLTLDRRGLVPQFQRAKPRGRPMPAHIVRGNATRGRVRARVEHVFAEQKRRLGLIIRSVGLVRATTGITLVNLAYNMRRLAWLAGRPVPA